MKEQTINLWDTTGDAICITTNGCIDSKGLAIMGGGCAYEAAVRYPDLPVELGHHLQLNGNHCYLYDEYELEAHPVIITFPTKAHPAMMSSPALIWRSAAELVEICDKYGYRDVYIPRPGCGLGGLKWEDVKPVLSATLDDRFTVVTT